MYIVQYLANSKPLFHYKYILNLCSVKKAYMQCIDMSSLFPILRIFPLLPLIHLNIEHAMSCSALKLCLINQNMLQNAGPIYNTFTMVWHPSNSFWKIEDGWISSVCDIMHLWLIFMNSSLKLANSYRSHWIISRCYMSFPKHL